MHGNEPSIEGLLTRGMWFGRYYWLRDARVEDKPGQRLGPVMPGVTRVPKRNVLCLHRQVGN